MLTWTQWILTTGPQPLWFIQNLPSSLLLLWHPYTLVTCLTPAQQLWKTLEPAVFILFHLPLSFCMLLLSRIPHLRHRLCFWLLWQAVVSESVTNSNKQSFDSTASEKIAQIVNFRFTDAVDILKCFVLTVQNQNNQFLSQKPEKNTKCCNPSSQKTLGSK